MLEAESQKYVTINTHRQYVRLPFGIASAPALFQQLMDTVLEGIPHVICYIDDILVTGTNDANHLQNLATVLECLEKHGLHSKRKNVHFYKNLLNI